MKPRKAQDVSQLQKKNTPAIPYRLTPSEVASLRADKQAKLSKVLKKN